MRTAIIAVLLALLLIFAGCASPQDDSEEGGEPGQAESPTTADNDVGAEPVNPPNETNGSEGNGTESGATVNPEDGNETGANESGTNATGANETGANETGANETGANETDGGDGESYEFANVVRPTVASPV